MWICVNLNTLTEWQHYQWSHKAASTVLIKNKICFFQNCSHVGLSADARVSIGGRLADGRQRRRWRRRGRSCRRWNDERRLRWKSEHNRQSHQRKDEKCGIGKGQEGKLVFVANIIIISFVCLIQKFSNVKVDYFVSEDLILFVDFIIWHVIELLHANFN